MAQVIRQVFINDNFPKTGTAFADPQLDAMFETYSHPRAAYFVVENEGRIVGGAGVSQLEHSLENICELQKMYFLEEARGKGVGFEMIEKCLKKATDFGYEKCYLETLPQMLDAQKLYKKTGFDYISQPMGNTGHTTCPVWMIRELPLLLKNYKTFFQQTLSGLYDEKETESFFYTILEKIHKLKRIDLALHPETEMNDRQLEEWKNIITDLKKEKPIQYILGETEFYGLCFEVNENTLIPRPETEELVEWILGDSRKSKGESRKPEIDSQKIMDIGTGSGCIAISLAKNLPDAQVAAIDVSEKALDVARKNAANHDVEVRFIQKNILETTDLEEQYDVIVSNPPYVRMLEKAEIQPNVLDYEPHLALFVEDNDALLFYRKIARLALKNLSGKGKLYFEINQYLGPQTVALLEGMGFKNVGVKKDLYGNDRMISCTK